MPRTPVTEEEKMLVRSQIHPGKDQSTPARTIANEVNLRSDRTDIRVRSIISALIEEDGIAIGSWSGGYYIIANDAELAETIEGIRVRIRGMQRRLKQIQQNFKEA